MYSRLLRPRISLGANIEYTNSYYRISNDYTIYIHYKILYIGVKPANDEGFSLQKIIQVLNLRKSYICYILSKHN